MVPYQILVIVVVDGGGGEKGRKQRYCFWRLLIKTAGPRALAGAALIDLLPLGHSSCSMLCRNSYLQCELPLPSSQATLQHPGSSTNRPHSVVAYAQRDVPMLQQPKFRDRTPPLPLAHRLVVLLYALSVVVLYSQLPLRVVPSSTFQHPFRNKTSPLHHLPARSSSCSVVYHTPSASCPCRSLPRPLQHPVLRSVL